MNAFVDQSEQEFHLGRGHPYLAGFMTFSFSTLFEMFQKLFDAELLKKNNLELENTADNWISKINEKNLIFLFTFLIFFIINFWPAISFSIFDQQFYA